MEKTPVEPLWIARAGLGKLAKNGFVARGLRRFSSCQEASNVLGQERIGGL
jgi:hypothetical protein